MKRTDTIGQFEQLVLTAVLTLRENAYGIPIYDKVCELAEKRVNFGSLYVALDRLERKGYLASRLSPPMPDTGKTRRYYRLEAPGETALRESLSTSRRACDAADGWWGLGKWKLRGAR